MLGGTPFLKSLPLYFSDMSPLDNEAPKLGPNRSTCHRSHQALPEQTSHVGLRDFPSCQGTGTASQFSARYKSAIWGETGNPSVTSRLNTSKSNYLLPFVTSQLLAKPSPGYAFSQPDIHATLSAPACQRPACSPLTLLLKYVSSQFAVIHSSKLSTHFVPYISVFTLSSQ